MKKQKVLILSIIFLVIALAFVLAKKLPKEKEIEFETKEEETKNNEASYVKVYLYGEVLRAGMYEVPSTWVLMDLLELAGTTKNANLGALNLAMLLKNHSSYYVPPYDLEPSYDDSLININTANLEELMTLNGIGEKTAERIIAYRRGKPFKTIEEIKLVPGIGEALYAKIRNFITV